MEEDNIIENFELSSDEAQTEGNFVVSLDAFEGPLDLLLFLAVKQKIDIAKMDILALAEQYIQFIERHCKEHLEEAASYLVMAAYLAYLKSRVLLPRDEEDDQELDAETQAEILAWRIKRLDAMRRTSARLMARSRLGIDVLARGAPEGIRLIKSPIWQDNLLDLVKAYATQKLRGQADKAYKIERQPVLTIEEAYKVLSKRLSLNIEWQVLERWLPAVSHASRRSTLASAFAAMLIMAKDGLVELKQTTPFAPIYLRPKSHEAETQRQKTQAA